MRNTYIYPPGPSMKIIADIFAYTAHVCVAFEPSKSLTFSAALAALWRSSGMCHDS